MISFNPKSSSDRLVLYSLESEGIPLFFQHYDSAFVPTLRLVHKCKPQPFLLILISLFYYNVDPNVLPSVMVDSGAIKSIINGADVMAPGLTSSASRLPGDLKPDIFVVKN